MEYVNVRVEVYDMKKSARRMCAFVLAAAMMIPLAGCKKGKGKNKGSSGPRKDYVEEDDPYFSSNEVELKIDPPENSDKEIESQELYSPRIVGRKISKKRSTVLIGKAEITQKSRRFTRNTIKTVW